MFRDDDSEAANDTATFIYARKKRAKCSSTNQIQINMTTKTPSWNDIRKRASAFAAAWASATDERAQAQLFWVEFFGIFGIDFKRVAQFEAHARRVSTGNRGRIDVFWPRVLLCEHKSAGKDLAEAEHQALDYLPSIAEVEQPRTIITSNFANIRLLHLEPGGEAITIKTADLAKEIERFGFIIGSKKKTFQSEDEANVQAARLMGNLYEELSRYGFEGHEVSILLTRLLFLLFGDDTGMWQRGLFAEFLAERTNADGSDLGPQLSLLFQEVNKPEVKRSQALDEYLMRFPYINGGLFRERLNILTFDRQMRDQLLEACGFDWGNISPAIFGSLFQTIKTKESRRELGEHYTPEKFILRTIGPLFLDEILEQIESNKNNEKELRKIRERLRGNNYLDPACGCGNFLIVAYKHLRKAELQILIHLDRLAGAETQLTTDPTLGLAVSLDQFSGIEIEEWPARIAETAMFLADHQANMELAKTFGEAPDRLPITSQSNIVIANALRRDWSEVCKIGHQTFIFGNPPFGGARLITDQQREDIELIWGKTKSSGNLDYVTCWHYVASKLMSSCNARTALVSTNSLAQGEQPQVIWNALNRFEMKIDFAHQTFSWASEAPGKAAVHCIIIGFSRQSVKKRKWLFTYTTNQSEPVGHQVQNINGYLVDGPNVLVSNRRLPLQSGVQRMTYGSMPIDDGHISDISDDEASEIRTHDPIATKYLMRLIGAKELINGQIRWCLWLKNADPSDLKNSTEIRKRSELVRRFRLASKREATRELADTPYLFAFDSQPTTPYLAIPRVSSENRRYVPIALVQPDVIASDALQTIANATPYTFGILASSTFMTWNSAVSGRLKSDFRISAEITYNNFPWPEDEIDTTEIEGCAKGVLLTRSQFTDLTLATLYDRLSMPKELTVAHEKLDRAVLAQYGLEKNSTEGEILKHLFDLYEYLSGQAKLPFVFRNATRGRSQK